MGTYPLEESKNIIPYYPGYKAMTLFPIQGHLMFWKIELVATYKAIAIPFQGHPFLALLWNGGGQINVIIIFKVYLLP